jgi:HK97 family phage major capsid protein
MSDQIELVVKATEELRAEIKSVRQDRDKIERINDFLDTMEEKVNQPLVLAQEQAKTHALEIKELQEKLEQAGATESEAKERIEALELEVARGRKSGNPAIDHKESPEYKALNVWCKKGEHRVDAETKQLLRTDSAVEGGVLVTSELDSVITKQITEIDPIRAISRVRTISSKSIEVPIRTSLPAATREGENEAGADSVSNYNLEVLTPFRLTHTSPVTMDMLQDSNFDMESEILSDSAEAFAQTEGQEFVNGSGFKQAEGFTLNATVQAAEFVGTGLGTAIDSDHILHLTGELKEGYNPVFVLNRRTLRELRKLRADAIAAADGLGGFLWQPGLNGQVANTLAGFPYVLANSMQDDGSAGNRPVAFGDFRRGYLIVDRTGVSVIRDDLTQKRRAVVEFTINRWNTGKVVLAEAITQVQLAA